MDDNIVAVIGGIIILIILLAIVVFAFGAFFSALPPDQLPKGDYGVLVSIAMGFYHIFIR